MRAWMRTGALGAMALAMAACGYLENRFKTCEDTPVTLVNSEQTLVSVHLLGEGESATSENLLRSGETRRLFQCLDKGDSQRFRAQAPDDPQPLATVNCVPTQASYESLRPRVLWTPVGLRCESW